MASNTPIETCPTLDGPGCLRMSLWLTFRSLSNAKVTADPTGSFFLTPNGLTHKAIFGLARLMKRRRLYVRGYTDPAEHEIASERSSLIPSQRGVPPPNRHLSSSAVQESHLLVSLPMQG